MSRQNLLLITVLCLGVLAGYTLLRVVAPGPAGQNAAVPADTPVVLLPDADNQDSTLTGLQQRLDQAEQERERLTTRVDALETLIGELGMVQPSGTGTPETATEEATESAAPAQTFRTSVEALIAAGIPADQASWIQARLDEYDLQQLYLKDRASREGWLKTARYNKERREYLTAYQELRPEIGDAAYDRMLFTLGRANRVVVRDTMQNSPGEQYGLRANDRIIEYDGQRVFTSQELNALVAEGNAGESVLVRVNRDDQPLDFYLPRGPIGVRLAASREAP
jgi:C-terminal processing protease CtpA/Prc